MSLSSSIHQFKQALKDLRLLSCWQIFALCVLNYDDFECILWSVVKNLCWNSQKWVISHFKTILHSWEIWQIILNVVEVSSLRISNKQLQRNVRTDDESQKKMQQKCAQNGYCLVFAKCRVTHDNGEECEKKYSISENRIQWSALATILANILSSPNSVHYKKFVMNFYDFFFTNSSLLIRRTFHWALQK